MLTRAVRIYALKVLMTSPVAALQKPLDHRRRRKLFLQVGTRLAYFGRELRTGLDLPEHTLRLLPEAISLPLQLLAESDRFAGHRFALFHARDELSTHALDVERRLFILADDGFGRQPSNFRSAFKVLDVVGHCERGRLVSGKRVGPAA